MAYDSQVNAFVSHVKALRFERSFNPYASVCPVSDEQNSPKIRCEMLEATLQKAVSTDVESIWLGRDLGYKGGRRTGIALTDERHLAAHGKRWGIKTLKATVDTAVHEQTANAVWEMLQLVEAPVFTWNVYPLHPHPADKMLANRSHTASERRCGEEVLSALVSLINPQRIIAIGKDAGFSAHRICRHGQEVNVVRHPSYGGRSLFRSALLELYDIQKRLGSDL